MIGSNDHRIGLDQSDSNQSDWVGQEFCMLQRKFPRDAVKVHFEVGFWFQAKLTIIFIGL
jgi:hypothetical protein